MAVHNELRRITQLQRALKIAFGLDSAEGGLERLGETLTPIVDTWAHPDHAFLRDERLMSATVDVAAGGAGTNGKLQVWNATSQYVFIITEIRVSTASAAQHLVYAHGSLIAATVAVTYAHRDFRTHNAGVAPAATVRADNGSGIPAGAARVFMETQPSYRASVFREPLVITPGSGVFATTQANLAAQLCISWRERLLLPGEYR